MSQTPQTKEKKANVDTKQKVMTIVGTILCIILLPVLVINVTLIVKSYVNTDEVPTLGGYCPMIVLTDSMFPEIEKGDLIICRTIDADKVKVGDVISFFDPASSKSSVVTHRVKESRFVEGEFVTKGDANENEDLTAVPYSALIGRVEWSVPYLGEIMSMASTRLGKIYMFALLLCGVLFNVLAGRLRED